VGYRTFEHTADVGIEAWGDGLPQAFEEAAHALFSLMADRERVGEGVERSVSIRADDPEGLLVAWLNELVGLVDAEGLVFRRAAIASLSATELRGRAYGETLDPLRHAAHLAVKAATYHGLSVEPGPPARVRVILDV